MNLRPVNFAVPNSTTLKILFNMNLSSSIEKENIYVEALSGNASDLRIVGLNVSGRVLEISTSPQQNKGFYLLKLNNDNLLFKSEKNNPLVNDSNSRNLYFIGFSDVNPVRDSFIAGLGKIYNPEGSNLYNILDVQADEYYRAKRSVGELLSDNYIRTVVDSELRKRTSGSTDVLANENVFKVSKISSTPTFQRLKSKTISIDNNSISSNGRTLEFNQIISLQEIYLEDEIDFSKIKLTNNGYVLTFPKNNILKINEIKIIKSSDLPDCENNIGRLYPIDTNKYGLLDNFYDKNFCFKRSDLKSNEVFINFFGTEITSGDRLFIKFLYKDETVSYNPETLDIHIIKTVLNEPLPTRSASIQLANQNIVSLSGNEVSKGGITFNSDFFTKDLEFFTKEKEYDMPQLLMNKGDYSVDYKNGIVKVYGDNGSGVLEDIVLANYYYKKTLEKDIDYFLDDNSNLFLNNNLNFEDESVKIFFEYDNIYSENIHYKTLCHKEVLNEYIDNNLLESFKLKTKHGPITKIFRIVNKTTGEIYNPTYSIDNEVNFSGLTSPAISNIKNESCLFEEISNEKLVVSNEFLNTLQEGLIQSAESASLLYFKNSFPIEDIESNANLYIVNVDTGSKFLINSILNGSSGVYGVTISDTSTFGLNTKFKISNVLLEFQLDNSNILNSSKTLLGSSFNSSLKFKEDSFIKEKFLNDNFNNLKNSGDYSVDYKKGKVFANLNENNPGNVNYYHSKIITSRKKIVSVNNLFYNNNEKTTRHSMSSNYIKLLDMPSGLEKNTGKIIQNNVDQKFEQSLIVNNSNKIVLDSNPKKINFIGKLSDIEKDNPTNYYSNARISENVIDLNILDKRKANIDNDIRFVTSKVIKTLVSIFDIKNQKYINNGNLFIKENIIPVSTEYNASLGTTKIYVSSDSTIYNIDLDDDFIFNNNNKLTISSLNLISNFIIVVGQIDSSKSIQLVSDITITNGLSNSTISIPLSSLSLFDLSSTYEILFSDKNSLDVGEKVFVDYEIGNLFVDYSYLKDDIYISYEYGDNKIDWSISDSLSEGDIYYVSYEYGALRNQLKKNFGSLTEIPFFNIFSLDHNREFYRDALEGTLQSFAKGPIKESFESLVSSITRTKPEIRESIYDGWILDRDYLAPSDIKYSDKITFEPCKYKEGISFDGNKYVSFKTSQNLPIQEGSIMCWTEPKWAGISNDAEIDFSFKNIGNSSYVYDDDKTFIDIFKDTNNSTSVFYKDIFYITNMREYFGVQNISEFMTFKKIEALDAGCKLNLSFEYKFQEQHSSFVGNQNLFTFIANDKNKLIKFDIKNKYVGSSSPYEFIISNTKSAKIPNFKKEVPEITCICSYPKRSELFGFYDDKVEITFSNSLNILNDITYSSKNDINLKFYLEDIDGNVFEVYSFKNANGKSIKVNSNEDIYGLFIKRDPLYRESLTKKFVNEDFLVPKTKFKLFYTLLEADLEGTQTFDSSFNLSNQKESFLIDYKESLNLKLILDPKQNSVNLHCFDKNKKYNIDYFYSDFDDIENDFSSFYNSKGIWNELFLNKIKNNSGLYFGNTNNLKAFTFGISKLNYKINYRFSEKNIYIGKYASTPKNIKFSSVSFRLSRFTKNIEGKPNFSFQYDESGELTSVSKEGIYIYIDNTSCIDYMKPSDDHWVVKFLLKKTMESPKDVYIENSVVKTRMKNIIVKPEIPGVIRTESDFYRANLKKHIDCLLGEDRESRLRYDSGNLTKDGWREINLSSSEDINLFINGHQAGRFYWDFPSYIDSEINEGTLFNLNSDKNYKLSTKAVSYNSGVTTYSVESKVTCDISKFKQSFSSTGKYTGIRLLDQKIDGYHLAVEYALFGSEEGIIIYDLNNNESIYTKVIKWNSLKVKQEIEYNSEGDFFVFRFNNLEIFRINLSDLSRLDPSETILDIHLRTANNYSENYNVEIYNIDFYSKEFKITPKENDEVSIHNNYIEFVIRNTSINVNSDGYISDGYIPLPQEGPTELLFVSDKERYLFDSKSKEARFSVFKSGNGYLNFRIDDYKKDEFYQLSTDIKNKKSHDLSHIIASWNINESDQRMSMYLDGKEVPKIYTVGSNISVEQYERFGDISKEKLQTISFKNINYYDDFVINTLASSNLATSSNITQSDVGRSLIIKSSSLYPDLVGAYIYISKVDNSSVYFKNGLTGKDYIFSTSSEVTVCFPPTSGISSRIYTNFIDDKYKIFINNKEARSVEYGQSSDYYTNSIFDCRVDLKNNQIEFLGINSDCKYFDSVTKSDSIHIQTYGLNLKNIKEKIEITSSVEKITDLTKYNFILSSIKTSLPRPNSLDSIFIKKIFCTNLIPEYHIDSMGINNWNITIDHEFISNLSQEVYKSFDFNEDMAGSILELDFFTYNIDLSENSFDLEIIGNNNSLTEIIKINKNGLFKTSNKFYELNRIRCNPKIIDIYEEPFSITIYEANSIFKEKVKLFKFSNGDFIFGKNQIDYESYNLSIGIYEIDYKTKLGIDIKQFGESIFVGNSTSLNNSWYGVVEELKIQNNYYTSQNAYKEFLLSIPSCPNETNLVLIPFNDPKQDQAEILREQKFLSSNNIKFSLDYSEINDLSNYFNNEALFTSKLISMGISNDVAKSTYFKVHKANNGPIKNISKFYQTDSNNGNRLGPNSNFSGSLNLNNSNFIINNKDNALNNKEFSIDMWFSPLFDSITNDNKKYLFDISNAKQIRLKSNNNKIIFPRKISKVIKINALTKSGKDFLDDSKLHGLYNIVGVSGSSEDFSIGGTLLKDSKTFLLNKILPKADMDIVAYYIPENSEEERISCYISNNSSINIEIKSKEGSYVSSEEIDLSFNSWHKILFCFDSIKRTMRLFLDGDQLSVINGVNPKFKNYSSKIVLGSDFYGDYKLNGKISSTRISRKSRGFKLFNDSFYKDINFSSSLELNKELIFDEYTTYLNNFDFKLENKKLFSEIIDPVSGIYNFEIDIFDEFNKLDAKYKKDLIKELINRIKPAHTNAIIKIKKDRC